MTDLICIDILGMGGWHLDPARGQLQIVRRLQQEGVRVIAPFDPADPSIGVTVQKVWLRNQAATYMYVGDSCGANRFGWMAAYLPKIQWRYAALIQPSLYCNAGCPPIGDNAREVDCFYTGFLTWPLPGLGCYKPHLAVPPPMPGGYRMSYPGSYVGNAGRTTINYIDQRIVVHPGDDDEGTQALILKKAQAIMAGK
jgi:hypothetical protein